MRKRLGARSGVLLAAVLGGLVVADSCGKEGLVIVSLTATPTNTALSSVVIDVGSVSKTFDVAGGLSDTPVSFGVYIPSDDLGSNELVAATATTVDRTVCYRGTAADKISTSSGATVSVTIELKSEKSCGSETGAAGAVGTGGTGFTTGFAGSPGTDGGAGSVGTTGIAGAGPDGGAGATGRAGASGAAGVAPDGGAAGVTGTAGQGGMAGMPIQNVGPPSLTKCTEYSHIPVSCDANSSDVIKAVTMWDVAFSTDGTRLATAGFDGKIVIWKMTGSTPSRLMSLSTTGQAYIAFSPDGKLFAEGSGNGELQVYDATTFTLISSLTGNSDGIEGIAFTSDSKHLWAIDYSGVLTRHDIGSSAAAATTLMTIDASNAGFVHGFALGLSPVSTATTQWIGIGFDDGSGDMANVAPGMTTPTPITVSSDGFGVFSMAFSPDGSTMVAGGDDGIIGFWTVPPPADGSPSATTITVPDSMNTPMEANGIRYSPDGKSLLIGLGYSDDEYKLGIWNAATRKMISMTTPTYAPLAVAWSPSGGIVAAGEDTCGKFIICSDN
jgi:hypothetical protein